MFKRELNSIATAILSILLFIGTLSLQRGCDMRNCRCHSEKIVGLSINKGPCCGCEEIKQSSNLIGPIANFESADRGSVRPHINSEFPVLIVKYSDIVIAWNLVVSNSLSPPMIEKRINDQLLC